MVSLNEIQKRLADYQDVNAAKDFFAFLRYPTIDLLPASEFEQLPDRPKRLIHRAYLIADCKPSQLIEAPTASQFRIYHVELEGDRLRRADFRVILDAFYRRFPQGNNLFVFTTSTPYREIAFVSPQRLLQRGMPILGMKTLGKMPKLQSVMPILGMKTLVKMPKLQSGMPILGMETLVKMPKLQSVMLILGMKTLGKMPKPQSVMLILGMKILVKMPKLQSGGASSH